MIDAQQLIMTFEQCYPEALHLAEVVSIAARVEPELLRRARLELVPEANAGDEADLWFSPLIQTSNPLGFVFYPEVAQILRERLARNAELLDKVWKTVIKEVHQGISPALFAEEEITWRALKNPNDPEIETLLRKALVAMVNENDQNGVAYWAMRALPNLPSTVHDMEATKMLSTGARLRLGDPETFLVDTEPSPIPNWMPLLLPPSMERVKIGVRFIPGAIEFGELNLMEGATELDLPHTNPLRVDVSWKQKYMEKHTYVLLRSGEFVSLALDANEIELQTVSGEKYRFFKKKDVGIDFEELNENLKDNNFDVKKRIFKELVNKWHDDPRTLLLIKDYALNAENKEIRIIAFNSLMEGWLDELLRIKELKYSKEFRLELAKGLVNASINYGNAYNFERMEFYLNELRELRTTLRDENVCAELARGLANASINYGNAYNFERMESCLNELRELRTTFGDENVCVELARGLANVTINYGNAYNFERMESCLNELRELYVTFQHKNVRGELSKSLVTATNNYGDAHNFKKMESCLNELRELYATFQDKNVKEGFARSLVIATNHYGNALDFERMEFCLNELHELNDARRFVADALRTVFPHISDKNKAWNDIHLFTLDKDNEVRRSAARTLGIAFSFALNKEHAWEDLHRLTSDTDSDVRQGAANALGSAFAYVPDKKRAWDDLHRLISDNKSDVRQGAANALGSAFAYVPDKKQAWDDLHRLISDNKSGVRQGAANALGSAFEYVPDKKRAWDDLHMLISDNKSGVRQGAANALGSAFEYVPDKKQAWDDLHRLISDNNSDVRRRAANALGKAFAYIPDKKQAWDDLHRLISDNKSDVRASVYHSMGKASIFKAANAENDMDLRKEMEAAIGYFEISSQQRTWSKPAKFCLPFYRSFYSLTFKKEEAEDEVQKYIADAKSAMEGSESKEKLLQAVENLGNALKEVQNARDFNDVRSALNAYRLYCERAADMLDAAEDKAPVAARLVRKGFPILDEKIKSILLEINEKAKMLCKQVKDTEFKEIGQQTNSVGQELLKVIDPIRLEKEVKRMIIPLTAMCNKMPNDDKGEAYEILRQINSEQKVEDKLPLISIFLSKISTQMNKVMNMENIIIKNSNGMQVDVGPGNKGVQESNVSSPKPEKELIKKPPISIDEKIKEQEASIEQILDKWGFKPGGFSYRKREEKKADIENWLHCFLPNEFEDAFQILEQIKYYDSHTVDGYIEMLSKELINVFNGDFSKILFYPLGEPQVSSGSNFLYLFRKNLGLTKSSFSYTDFNNIDLSDKKAIVFFDDFIWLGNTAVRFAEKHLHDIKIDKYFVALIAFEKGLEKVRDIGCFRKVIVHEIISEELRAFSPDSQVFPDAETRERIKKLCEKYGKLLYPKHPLGYEDSQALIVFPHNTPINTLPIIWASDKNEKEPGYVWYPVWERLKMY